MKNMRRLMTTALAITLSVTALAQAKSRNASLDDEISAKLAKANAAWHLVIDTAEKLKSSNGSPQAAKVAVDYCRKLQAADTADHEFSLALGASVSRATDADEVERWTSIGRRTTEKGELVKRSAQLEEEVKAMGVRCAFGALLTEQQPPLVESPPAPKHTPMPVHLGVLLWIVGFIAVAVVYFAPSVIGNRKANRWAIFTLNLLAGWTIVGWIVAMVWAFCAEPSEKPVLSHSTNGAMSQKAFCGHCGSPVTTAFCRTCGRRTAL